MYRRWTVTLAFLLLAVPQAKAGSVHGDPTEGLRAQRAMEFRIYADRHFSFSLLLDVGGRIVVRKSYFGPHAPTAIARPCRDGRSEDRRSLPGAGTVMRWSRSLICKSCSSLTSGTMSSFRSIGKGRTTTRWTSSPSLDSGFASAACWRKEAILRPWPGLECCSSTPGCSGPSVHVATRGSCGNGMDFPTGSGGPRRWIGCRRMSRTSSPNARRGTCQLPWLTHRRAGNRRVQGHLDGASMGSSGFAARLPADEDAPQRAFSRQIPKRRTPREALRRPHRR